eukprot:gene2837-4244_t
MSYKFICVLDFEATCDDKIQLNPQEIIEFPSVLLQYTEEKKLEKVSKFQFYVAPKYNPKLTKFCTQLTGITTETVKQGVSFEKALQQHENWLTSMMNEKPTQENLLMITCGDWDLKTILPLQCQTSNIQVPKYFKKWTNLKILLSKYTKNRINGMTDMLEYYNLELEGRHHSGIDDCDNIANVTIEMFKNGISLVPTTQYIGNNFNRMKIEKKVKNYKISKLVKDINPDLKFNQ